MKALIIGAGRGRRLMPSTAENPKCLAEVSGRPILDWIVEAFASNGVTEICFIGGYRIDQVRAAYPRFRFYSNERWEHNNILVSLMCAEPEMDEPFVSCYADTLFRPQAAGRLLAGAGDIALLIDTDWRARYALRTHHPPTDAEKVTARNGRITAIRRDIDEAVTHGEFTGMARFSAAGAALLRDHYHRAGLPEKAYLIHLFQEMIEKNVAITHVDTPGGYMEIDTQQDFELARRHWGAGT